MFTPSFQLYYVCSSENSPIADKENVGRLRKIAVILYKKFAQFKKKNNILNNALEIYFSIFGYAAHARADGKKTFRFGKMVNRLAHSCE